MESIAAALQDVQDGKGLRDTARTYNVLVETLSRRVAGSVAVDCRSGPNTVLTAEEEEALMNYCL